MRKPIKKVDFPVSNVRRYLEPGPIVLISSCWENETNIMTLGWQTVMEFMPSLVGCLISSGNHSFDLIRKSRECVINVPSVDLIDTVVRVGSTSGETVDKFDYFGLSKQKAAKVHAPLIDECFANFECRIYDDRLVDGLNFFVLEIVKAHVLTSPKNFTTIHYRGDGEFMLSGKTMSRRKLLTKRG